MISLEEALSGSDVVFVIGSGVSAITSGGSPTATWSGLIRSGADRAQKVDPTLDDQWRSLVDGLLAYPDTNTVIQSAGMVASALRRIGGSAFSQWLEDDIGALRVEDDSVAKALLAYPFPILTTNYDTLLESVGGRRSVDWTDLRGFHEVVTRATDAVGHLHGLWNNPKSIVLSESDYAQFASHESIQALERAVSALKSIVYVGFGAGLADPNFSALLRWHRAAFPESGVTHFRLCRLDEEADLQRLHADERVVPVPYGDNYEDLAPLLRARTPQRNSLVLNEAGLARDVVQESRDLLRHSMTAESVLMEAGGGEFGGTDLIVPPVLLPVPYASYVRERNFNGKRRELEHLDGYREAESHDFFVVVGDEGSGLSTAVKWLAAQSSEVLGAAAPLFLRFSDCRNRKAPLKSAVVNAAMTSGLVHDRTDNLPAHILAVDDFDVDKRRTADAVLAEIVQSPAIVKIIGCRLGGEDELVRALRSAGVDPRVLFLGRMRKSHIVDLAERFSPGQGERLAEDAMRVLDGEGLKRTPLTVSLLLYQLYRGGPQEVASQTSMIDAHLSLLLGVGNPHENGTGLTDTDLQAILANLAESMIWDEKPSLPEHEAVRIISEVLKKYGWSASPTETLGFLIRRRILIRHGDNVEFGRYAYFTLFAARRATVDADFRDLIIDDMFYYEPVASRLAALIRTDEELLERLEPLLRQELDDVTQPGSPYELLPVRRVDAAPPAVDSSEDAIQETTEDDEYEFPESDSPGSFGLVKADLTPAARIHRTVRLASSVLRDLDQVEKLDLKRELLVMTLELWGHLITALSADAALTDLKEVISRSLIADDGDDKPEAGDFWTEFLARAFPAGTVVSGMETTLISPKLNSTLDEALNRGELVGNLERKTATLFLLFLLRPNGWASKATKLLANADHTWVIAKFFRAMCEDAYVRGATPEHELMELCKALFAIDQEFTSHDLRSAYLDQYAQKMRNLRARAHQASRPQR